MPDERRLPATLAALRQAQATGERHFPGLRWCDLDGVDLDLSHCILRGGCLREARSSRASLANADVEGCGFQRSLLWGAELGVDLREAAVYGANFCRADLRGADLRALD